MGPSNALDLRLIIIAIYATSMEVLKQLKKKKKSETQITNNFLQEIKFSLLV
jgi:hypothetical protein